MMRIAILVACALGTGALGYGAYLLARLAPIGTAYAAKTLCSGVFVSHRAAEDVIREDIRADNHPLLVVIRPWVEASAQQASATFFGLARRDALFRPGLGCTLALGTVQSAETIAANVSDAQRPDAFAPDDDTQVDRDRLKAVVDNAFGEPDPKHPRRTRAVVVLHRGGLLYERYADGFTARTPMLGWSMTKSVTAALIGILVREGRLSIGQDRLLPEWRGVGDPRSQIRLDHLLRMTSGLSFTENHGDPLEDVAVMLFARRDAAGYAIDKPLSAPLGTRWSYSSGTSNILAAIMRGTFSTSADYLAFPRRALFEPLGMRNAVLETDAAGNFLTSSYLYASPHDWARFGQLLLQDGVWQGQRLLPEGWVTYMSRLTPQSARQDFGAHLWVKVPPPFDSLRRPKPALPADAFHAVGHEGQFVSVIPSRRLVVVRLGLSRGSHVWDHDAFLAKLLTNVPQ
jgi:CubicO group peptidase (beta-lactamase class C family)